MVIEAALVVELLESHLQVQCSLAGVGGIGIHVERGRWVRIGIHGIFYGLVPPVAVIEGADVEGVQFAG